MDDSPASSTRIPTSALLTALAAALLALGLYLLTVRPQVGPSLDSTELHLGVITNGIVHPPGSPQYLLLGRLAVMALPGPDAAYRLNLFSALCTAGAVGFLHLTIFRLTRHNVVSALSALGFTVAPRVWYLASIAELYALNSLYLAAVIYLLVAWHQTRRPALYWASAVIYAFSFGNHTSMLMLFPAFLYMVAITDLQMIARPRNFLLNVLIVALAASQYLLVYVRMNQHPAYCNFCPETSTPGWFADFITGSDFRESFFSVGRRDALARIAESMHQFGINYMPWGMILGAIGAWEMLQRQRKMALFLLTGLLGEWVFIMGYNIPDWHDFMTPSYVIFTPLLGYGLLCAWQAIMPRLTPMLSADRTRWLSWVRRAAAPALALIVLAALLLKVFEYYPNIRDNTQTDWEPKVRTLLAASEGETWVLMPYSRSAAYYYAYSIPYYVYLDGAPEFSVIPPPDIELPLGSEPLYRTWKSTEDLLTPDALVERQQSGSLPTLIVIDPSEARVAEYGLLPICAPGSDLIAGYEVTAVEVNGEVVPLVDAERWAAVGPWVVFGGAAAACPP